MDIEEIRKQVIDLFEVCNKNILLFLSKLNQSKYLYELKKEVLNLNTY